MTTLHPCPFAPDHPCRHAWNVWEALVQMGKPHGPEPLKPPQDARGHPETTLSPGRIFSLSMTGGGAWTQRSGGADVLYFITKRKTPAQEILNAPLGAGWKSGGERALRRRGYGTWKRAGCGRGTRGSGGSGA